MRYVRLRAEIWKVKEAYPDLGLIVFEAAHHRGGHATQYALGCQAVIEAWCAEHEIEHASVHTGTLKRFATGRGNADKQAMIFAALDGLRRSGAPAPHGRLSSDEADAICLLTYATLELIGAGYMSPNRANP